MERLTKKAVYRTGNEYVSAIGTGAGAWPRIIQRLAAYENTGLEPEEIMAALQKKDSHKQNPLTQDELRKMNGATVYCLELNTEARVSAYKTGWITIHYPLPRETDCCKAKDVTLFRTKPKEV